MTLDVAIIVVAFNRPRAMARLLDSIAHASFSGFEHVPLILSIDGGGPSEVVALAKELDWPYGPKSVCVHPQNLGLKQHILTAGDLVSDYDGIIMLEDDLVVSPQFYRYAHAALTAYSEQGKIGGISLYSARSAHGMPFFPSVANGNSYLVRFPSSWGQAWTRSHWQDFRGWLATSHPSAGEELDRSLPASVGAWPTESSWKKEFARYLVDIDRYIVYPDSALSTNMGDAGVHFRSDVLTNQTPLQQGFRPYDFVVPESAVSYDQFFELESRSLSLLGCHDSSLQDIEFDLYGRKPYALLRGKRVISSKRAHTKTATYGLSLLPHELNVLHNIPGERFVLTRAEELEYAHVPARLELMEHHTALLGGRDLAKLLLERLTLKLRQMR